MAEHKEDDGLSKALGVVIALGALAVGVGAALANNERTRQMRAEMKQRLDELGRRVDDLSSEAQKRAGGLASQAQHVIEERRPEIEQTIQRTREAVTQGLDKARTAVEQGAEKAQEYVQRVADKAGEATDSASGVVGVSPADVGENAEELASSVGERAGEMVEGAQAAVGDAGSTVRDWTGEAGQQLSEMLSEAGESASDVGEQAGSTVRDWTSTTFETSDGEGSDGASIYGGGEGPAQSWDQQDGQPGSSDAAVGVGSGEGDAGGQGERDEQGSGYMQATLGNLDSGGGGETSTDNPDLDDANADIDEGDNSPGDGGVSGTSGTFGDSGASDATQPRSIGTAPLMENLGTAGLDALRSDDLASGGDPGMSTEDVLGEGTFTEQAAEESGYQMSGVMHSHETGTSGDGGVGDNYGASDGAEATDMMEQGDGDITRIDYDQQTGGLISSGRAGWANTSELSEGNMSGEAAGAGAPEFGSGSETAGGYGSSDAAGDAESQPDFSSGQQTIPFRNDYPGENLETDNEPPHPGDTSTTNRSESY